MKKKSVLFRQLGLAGLMSACLSVILLNPAHAVTVSSLTPYAIGLWGDMPYNDIQATTGVPNLIADMNRQSLAFTVHDGDLKAGNGIPGSTTVTTCDLGVYIQGWRFLNRLRAPAMFTPGDNDWTDCDRSKNGSFNSLERLDLERKIFFATNLSLGGSGFPYRQLPQEVQTEALCLDHNGQNVPCVENRRWTYNGVTYATLNIQGSCNNLCDTNPDPAEFAARNAANIRWMQDTFDQAMANGSVAVMLISQANPGWDMSDPTRAPTRDPKTLVENDFLPSTDPLAAGSSTVPAPDGFAQFLVAMRDKVVNFAKPVVYVHGDSHYFRIDKPLLNSVGQRVENFTRVETYGDNAANGTNDNNWIRVVVSPVTREVFQFQPQVVPANRVAVPAPIAQ